MPVRQPHIQGKNSGLEHNITGRLVGVFMYRHYHISMLSPWYLTKYSSNLILIGDKSDVSDNRDTEHGGEGL